MQRKRFFPLPDFKVNEFNKVEVKIIGKVIDENYTNLLMINSGLDIKIVFLLDKIQKKELISKKEIKLVGLVGIASPIFL